MSKRIGDKRGLFGLMTFGKAKGMFKDISKVDQPLANKLVGKVLATLPQGLLLDLEWRSGLARLPPPAS